MPAERDAARARLRIGPAEQLIVSFGFLVPAKAIGAALAAFALLKRERPAARLVFVGEVAMDVAPLRDEAASLGVTLGTGFVTPETYRAWAAAADAGLQLRIGQAGGVSAALQDGIGAGLNMVASRDLAETIAAPDYVLRVADVPDVAEIAGALARALVAPRPEKVVRAAYFAAHDMEAYAERLLEMIL